MLDTDNRIAGDLDDHVDFAAPPVRLDQHSVAQPPIEAKTPGEPMALEAEETDSSSLDDMFLQKPPPRVKLPSTSTSKPNNEPSRLAAGRRLIESRNEAIDVPFTQISDEIRRRLEDAEKTKGGPKKVLAQLLKIANTEALKEVAATFGSGDEENPNEDYLECIRRMMVLEAITSKSNAPMENDVIGKGIEDRNIKSESSHWYILAGYLNVCI